MHTLERPKVNGATPAGRPPRAMRWMQVPAGSWVLLQPDGTYVALEPEISAREAARLLGISVRSVQMKCDFGVLVEGRDWRKLPALGANGSYRIQVASVMRLLKG